MKCNHCGSEWTTSSENQKDTCPFCGKQITRITTGQSSPIDKFFDEQIRKIQEQQGKDIRWAKLLDCKPGEKPWIIKSSFFVSADKRADKLITRIKNIHDQELLALIVAETNDGRVRMAAVKNIADQSTLEQLAYNEKHDIRLAVIDKIKNTKVLEHIALNDADPSVRMATLKHITSQPILQVIAETDADNEVRKAAIRYIKDQKVVAQVIFDDPDWCFRKSALCYITDQSVLRFFARSDTNAEVRKIAVSRQIDSQKNAPAPTVAALFENIKGDLCVNTLPTKIMLYRDGIGVFEGDTPVKKIVFSKYGFDCLSLYNYWWCTDRTESPGGSPFNELEYLAKLINTQFHDQYAISDKIVRSESQVRSDMEWHTLHTSNQSHVEMIKS